MDPTDNLENSPPRKRRLGSCSSHTRATKRLEIEGDYDVIDLTGDDDEDSVVPEAFFPMYLFHVRDNLPEWANSGFLGAKLSDLIIHNEHNRIEWMLISNFKIDLPWLLSACPVRHVPRVLIIHGESLHRIQEMQHTLLTERLHDRVHLHSPPVPPYGTHHSKAFLIQYNTGLRVIIHTANLLYCDVHNKTQGLWVQDFPRKDEQHPPSVSQFESDLLQYLSNLKLPDDQAATVSRIVSLHDFSAARAHLIASVPYEGNPSEETSQSFGHLKLRKCLQKEPSGNFPNSLFHKSPVVAQYSSIGNLSAKWLSSFVDSLSASKHNVLDRPTDNEVHLVWPTIWEVKNSLEGWFAGSSIPGRPAQVLKPWLQPHYRKFDGSAVGRERAMPHLKSYIRFSARATDGLNRIAWICTTSHNLSKAAWGEEITRRAGQGLQTFGTGGGRRTFKILSYELGVLAVPSLELQYRKSQWYNFSCTDGIFRVGPMPGIERVSRVEFVQWDRTINPSNHASIVDQNPGNEKNEAGNHQILRVPLPIPYSIPPTPYRYNDGDKPWDTRKGMDTVWSGPDSLGVPFPGVGAHYGVLDHLHWRDLLTPGT